MLQVDSYSQNPPSQKMPVALIPKPRVLISTLALFELFELLPCSSSPDNGISLGSIDIHSVHWVADPPTKTPPPFSAKPSPLYICKLSKPLPPFLASFPLYTDFS